MPRHNDIEETTLIARALDLWWAERQRAAEQREVELKEIEEFFRRALEERIWAEAAARWEKY